jgi:hypothetical protein
MVETDSGNARNRIDPIPLDPFSLPQSSPFPYASSIYDFTRSAGGSIHEMTNRTVRTHEGNPRGGLYVRI